jgi:hypothetical protein
MMKITMKTLFAVFMLIPALAGAQQYFSNQQTLQVGYGELKNMKDKVILTLTPEEDAFKIQKQGSDSVLTFHYTNHFETNDDLTAVCTFYMFEEGAGYVGLWLYKYNKPVRVNGKSYGYMLLIRKEEKKGGDLYSTSYYANLKK